MYRVPRTTPSRNEFNNIYQADVRQNPEDARTPDYLFRLACRYLGDPSAQDYSDITISHRQIDPLISALTLDGWTRPERNIFLCYERHRGQEFLTGAIYIEERKDTFLVMGLIPENKRSLEFCLHTLARGPQMEPGALNSFARYREELFGALPEGFRQRAFSGDNPNWRYYQAHQQLQHCLQNFMQIVDEHVHSLQQHATSMSYTARARSAWGDPDVGPLGGFSPKMSNGRQADGAQWSGQSHGFSYADRTPILATVTDQSLWEQLVGLEASVNQPPAQAGMGVSPGTHKQLLDTAKKLVQTAKVAQNGGQPVDLTDVFVQDVIFNGRTISVNLLTPQGPRKVHLTLEPAVTVVSSAENPIVVEITSDSLRVELETAALAALGSPSDAAHNNEVDAMLAVVLLIAAKAPRYVGNQIPADREYLREHLLGFSLYEEGDLPQHVGRAFTFFYADDDQTRHYYRLGLPKPVSVFQTPEQAQLDKQPEEAGDKVQRKRITVPLSQAWAELTRNVVSLAVQARGTVERNPDSFEALMMQVLGTAYEEHELKDSRNFGAREFGINFDYPLVAVDFTVSARGRYPEAYTLVCEPRTPSAAPTEEKKGPAEETPADAPPAQPTPVAD